MRETPGEMSCVWISGANELAEWLPSYALRSRARAELMTRRARMPRWLRVRMRYFALAVGTILLGLAVHLRGGALSPDARDILGDALWAAMAAWWIAAVAPAIGLSWRATMALAFCFAIEFSQLVHVPALDTLRRTTVGHLALGSGFDPRDFASYAAGVLAAYSSNGLMVGSRKGRSVETAG